MSGKKFGHDSFGWLHSPFVAQHGRWPREHTMGSSEVILSTAPGSQRRQAVSQSVSQYHPGADAGSHRPDLPLAPPVRPERSWL